MNLQQLLIEYLEYLEIELSRSQKTIENYHRYLKRFLSWTKATDPKNITDDVIRSYRLYLNRIKDKNGKTLKRATQNYHVIAIRNFLKYMTRRDIRTLSAEKIDVGKNPSREIEVLTNEEIDRLLKTAEGSDIKSLRDKAILELLFSAGLRVSELTSLDRDHIDLERQEFSVRGKGDKIRVVFVSETAKDALAKYLDKRLDINEALFIRYSNKKNCENESKRLTQRSIQRIVKARAAQAGIVKDVHPHTLRHSFATDLLSNGADIRSVQTMLGHSSIVTTQIYTHLTNQQLRDVHKKFHGKTKQ